MKKIRHTWKARSNNDKNPNKNICALAVARAIGVDHKVRYLHCLNDVIRACRAGGYTVRSRKSSVKGTTVGAIRNQLEALGADFYIVRVDGHVLLLGCYGKTLIDTDPRKRDRRKITHVYGVWHPSRTP